MIREYLKHKLLLNEGIFPIEKVEAFLKEVKDRGATNLYFQVEQDEYGSELILGSFILREETKEEELKRLKHEAFLKSEKRERDYKLYLELKEKFE